MHDLERCLVCPNEITEGEPSISIIDNDDFFNDILTVGDTAHRCNWMFLQHLEHRSTGVRNYKANHQDEHVTIKDPKIVSQTLTEKASEMQAVTPYRTIKRGEPHIRPENIVPFKSYVSLLNGGHLRFLMPNMS